MRSALLAFGATFGAGLVLLLALAGLSSRSDAFTIGVAPSSPLAIPPAAQVCQRPIDPPAGFSRVRLEAAAGRSRLELELAVRRDADGGLVASGRHDGPSTARRAIVVDVGDVNESAPIAVCARNLGARPIELFGNVALAHPGSVAYLAGERVEWDASLRFERSRERSLLLLTGEMVDRAALFRGDWVGAGAIWAVIALLLAAFPLLLVRALREVAR